MFLRQHEKIIAFLFFVACFALIYPDLFFLAEAPMYADNFTLKDPTVSWSVYIPEFREFRYELLEHGNILWSNLRGMGQPLLGNAIQGAPLFPLNLALIGIPDLLYWSVMPIARIILISLGIYLISRKVFKLSPAASAFCALLVGFNINVARWMNHPWTNGFLAGIWYLYFLCRISLVDTAREQTLISVGLIISVFAMITTGFPEASAMSAIFVVFIYLGFCISNWPVIQARIGKIVLLIIVCHIIGFSLGAIQFIPLLEYIQYSGTLDHRSDYSAGTYTSEQVVPYWLAQLSAFWPTAKQQDYTVFSVGLFGLFFAIHGLVAVILNFVKRSNTNIQNGISIMLIFCMLLFVLKAFGWSELVVKVFAVIPVLGQSHFPLYFSPIFFLGSAYLSAVGFNELLINSDSNKTRKLVISFIAFFTTLLLCSIVFSYFHQAPTTELWSSVFSKTGNSAIQIFLLGGLILIVFQCVTVNKSTQLGVPAVLLIIAILVATIIELNQTLPKNFRQLEAAYMDADIAVGDALDTAFKNAPIPQYELRGTNKSGDFVGLGLATADNGASAIMPAQLRQLRLSLFATRYGGYSALVNPRSTWSYDAMSANISEVHSTAISEPDWQNHSSEPLLNATILNWDPSPKPLANPFYFEGSINGAFAQPSNTEVWLYFTSVSRDTDDVSDNPQESFWIQANMKGLQVRDAIEGRHPITTHWRIRVPSAWLTASEYIITPRLVDPAKRQYDDAQGISLKLDRDHPIAIAGEKFIHLASSNDKTRSFMFNADALPRAYIAKGCQPSSTQKDEMEFYRADNTVIKGHVVFPYDSPTKSVDCETYQNKFARIPITRDDRTTLELASVKGPALVLLNDSYYPGWQAYDSANGSKTKMLIERANTNARSIYLPEPRDYQLSFEYQPVWLTWVYTLLVLAAIISVFLWWLIWRRGL